MSDADAQALVAYLNTLAPVRNPLPRTKVNFLVRWYAGASRISRSGAPAV